MAYFPYPNNIATEVILEVHGHDVGSDSDTMELAFINGTDYWQGEINGDTHRYIRAQVQMPCISQTIYYKMGTAGSDMTGNLYVNGYEVSLF